MEKERGREGGRKGQRDRDRERIRMRFESWFGFWPFLWKGNPPELKLILYFRTSKSPSRNTAVVTFVASHLWIFGLMWSFVNPSLQQEGSGAYSSQSSPSRGINPPVGVSIQTSRCSNDTNSFHSLSSGACPTVRQIVDFASHRWQMIFRIYLRITHISPWYCPRTPTLSLGLKVADRVCQFY